MAQVPSTSILILAGQRSGTLDPVAAAAGVSHKCLVPVQGQSLIGRVLSTVESALPESPIFVSIEDFDVLAGEPTVDRLLGLGRLRIVKSDFNLVDSVRAASDVAGFPLLITTADNVLVSAEAIHALVAEGRRGSPVSAILVMARKEDIEAAHSGGKGRYYEFRGGGYSNCNLFWLGDAVGLAAANTFRDGGQFLKVAGRMHRAFGLLNVLLFRAKLLTLNQAMRSISKRIGANVQALVLNDGRLAIDVDDQRSKEMVEELLRSAACQ